MAKRNKESIRNDEPPKIDWIETRVPVAALKPFERNPRRISESAYQALLKSLREDGYHQRILATQDYRIIGGHQRQRALQELGYNDICVLVPSQPISDDDFRRIIIRDNLPFGEFDFDILANDYTSDELSEIGMPADWLPKSPFDDDEPKKEKQTITDSTGFCILIETQTEAEQEALFSEFQERGLLCRLMS